MQWVLRLLLPPDLKMQGRNLRAAGLADPGDALALGYRVSLMDEDLAHIGVNAGEPPGVFQDDRLAESRKGLVDEADPAAAGGQHLRSGAGLNVNAFVDRAAPAGPEDRDPPSLNGPDKTAGILKHWSRGNAGRRGLTRRKRDQFGRRRAAARDPELLPDLNPGTVGNPISTGHLFH